MAPGQEGLLERVGPRSSRLYRNGYVLLWYLFYEAYKVTYLVFGPRLNQPAQVPHAKWYLRKQWKVS